jgi:hypothetical protein
VAGLAIALLAFGSLVAAEMSDFIAYSLIVVAALLPAALWISLGARGIPIIPVIALGHIVYFAMPILRGTPAELGYDDADTLRGAATVSLFLVVASCAAYLAMLRAAKTTNTGIDPSEGQELNKLMLGGLAVGAMYQLALLGGALNWLGY